MFLAPPISHPRAPRRLSEHGVKVKDAICFTGATCFLTSLYQRVNCFCKRKVEEELADTASFPFNGGIHRNQVGNALEGLSDPFEVVVSPVVQSFM